MESKVDLLENVVRILEPDDEGDFFCADSRGPDISFRSPFWWSLNGRFLLVGDMDPFDVISARDMETKRLVWRRRLPDTFRVCDPRGGHTKHGNILVHSRPHNTCMVINTANGETAAHFNTDEEGKLYYRELSHRAHSFSDCGTKIAIAFASGPHSTHCVTSIRSLEPPSFSIIQIMASPRAHICEVSFIRNDEMFVSVYQDGKIELRIWSKDTGSYVVNHVFSTDYLSNYFGFNRSYDLLLGYARGGELVVTHPVEGERVRTTLDYHERIFVSVTGGDVLLLPIYTIPGQKRDALILVNIFTGEVTQKIHAEKGIYSACINVDGTKACILTEPTEGEKELIVLNRYRAAHRKSIAMTGSYGRIMSSSLSLSNRLVVTTNSEGQVAVSKVGEDPVLRKC